MPFLKNYHPMKKVVSTAKEKMDSLQKFYKKTIREHQESYNPNNLRDVIDAFLLEMETNTLSKDFFHENQLTVILADLFLAGSETTGKSMEWGCLFMVLHPEVNFLHVAGGLP